MSDISGLGEFFCHACTLPDNVEELRRKYFNLSPFERRRLKEVRAILDRVLTADPPLCAGYVEAVAAREARGFYEGQEEWRRAVLRGCVEYIVAVETGEAPYREGGELPPELGEFIARELNPPADSL